MITGTQILDGSGGTPATAGALSAASAAAPASVGKGTLNNLAGGIVRAGSELRLGGGTLHNAGTLDIGGQGISQTRLQGDLKQEAGGHLVVDIDTINRQADKLVVDGSAQLAGTVHVRPASLSPHAVTVIQARDGTTVDPSTTVQDAGGNLLFGYQLGNADGGGVTVTPFSKLASSSVAAGVGPGRASLARHLDAGFNDAVSDKQAHVYAQLAALPAMAGVSSALDNLSGEALQSAAITRLIGSMQFSERMNTVRCDAREKLGAAPREADCSWARVLDGRTTRDATADESGFVLDSASLQGGFQRRVAPNWFVGGALSYDNSSLRADSIDQRVTGNGGSVGAVLKYESGPWMVSGSADIGHGRYDSTRHIAFGDINETAKARFGMWHAGLHSRVAYLLPLDGYYLRPYVDVHAVRIRTDGYQESGADALDLQVQRSSRTYMTVAPMLEFGGVHDLASGMQLRSFAALGAALHGNASGQAEGPAAGLGQRDRRADVHHLGERAETAREGGTGWDAGVAQGHGTQRVVQRRVRLRLPLPHRPTSVPVPVRLSAGWASVSTGPLPKRTCLPQRRLPKVNFEKQLTFGDQVRPAAVSLEQPMALLFPCHRPRLAVAFSPRQI